MTVISILPGTILPGHSSEDYLHIMSMEAGQPPPKFQKKVLAALQGMENVRVRAVEEKGSFFLFVLRTLSLQQHSDVLFAVLNKLSEAGLHDAPPETGMPEVLRR